MPDHTQPDLESRLENLGRSARARSNAPVPNSLLAAVAARRPSEARRRASWPRLAIAAVLVIAGAAGFVAVFSGPQGGDRPSPVRVDVAVEPTVMLGPMLRANLRAGSAAEGLRLGVSPDMRHSGVSSAPTRPIRPGLTTIP